MFQSFIWNAVILLPTVFYWAVFIAALLLYVFANHAKAAVKSKIINYKTLIITAIAFRLGYGVLEAIGRYYIWTGNAVGQTFINNSLSDKVPENFVTSMFHDLFQTKLGYFLYYSYTHYFLNPILVIICAFLFYTILKILQKYQSRFFDTGETELGFLLALIVGWPGFVVFVPLSFLAVIFVSIIRGIFLREPYTTLGYPFLLAALLCLLFNAQFISILGLSVLKISNNL